MHVYISIDAEGVAGIATFDQVVRGGTGYERMQQLMTAEANAAIAGAFDAGADSVTVNDSHGTMDNLIHQGLDPRARVIFGSPKAECMMHGLTADHDVALFVGYHAPAGVPGVLSHSFSSFFNHYRINGEAASEAEVNALYAGALNVPVGLVTGDDVICSIAKKRWPDTVVAEVKRAAGNTAADTVHPTTACTVIREASAAAVANAADLAPPPVPDELALEVEMSSAGAAELASLVPGAERTSQYGVRCHLSNPQQVMGLTSVWYELAAAGLKSAVNLLNRR